MGTKKWSCAEIPKKDTSNCILEVNESPQGILLLFPPVSEARQFAYSSLPMLSAWLRKRGIPVWQRDLNLELSWRLLDDEYLVFLEKKFSRIKTVAGQYRLELVRHLRQHRQEIIDTVRNKPVNNQDNVSHSGCSYRGFQDIQAAVRLVRTGVELGLEDSQIGSTPARFADAVSIALADNTDLVTSILDELLTDSLRQASNPRVVGLSVAFHSQLVSALWLAKRIRELRPQAVIVMGGPLAQLHASTLYNTPGFAEIIDAIGTGAGESALEDLYTTCAKPESKKVVNDILWCSSGVRGPKSQLHLNELPPPDVSDLPIRDYILDEVQIGLVTCVGCYWGRCTFCSYGQRHRIQGTYQQASPATIANWCQSIIEQTGVERISFVDENTNLRAVIKAMRLLNSRGLRIRFSTRNRLEKLLLNAKMCEELAFLGCELMSVGLESVSQRLLDAADKGVESKHYSAILSNLYQAGINVRVSVMAGLPGETEAEAAMTWDFLREHSRLIGIDATEVLVLEPGTPLADNPHSYRLQLSDLGRPVHERILQGNPLLNYRGGRMGLPFSWDGGLSREEVALVTARRSRTFVPLGNDEIPPSARQGSTPNPPKNPHQLEVLPWVKLIQTDGSHLLVDLVWQSFFPLPGGVRILGSTLFVDSATVAMQLIRAGLAK